MFNFLDKPPLLPITTTSIDGKRYYLTPDGQKLPSVTTVLGAFEKAGITKWKNRVGEKEAGVITRRAATRGTSFHTLAEEYIQNKDIDYKALQPDMAVYFKRFTKLLDHINNIHYIEVPLYSYKLGVAGRTDCIGEYDGILSIIDHKSSMKIKKKEWITHYFEQETAYALMYFHMTGIPIEQIVILIHEDEGSEPRAFIEKTKDYILSLKSKIQRYKEMYPNVS